jgi:hypothetical protein
LERIFNKVRLPLDWEVLFESDRNAFIPNTYLWFRDNYNPANPVHHLALLIGIILSCCTPKLFAPASTGNLLEGVKDRRATREITQKAVWVEKDKKRGMSNRSNLLSMFSTFIAAIYDKDSPLRKHMASKNDSMGPWSPKHSEYKFFD